VLIIGVKTDFLFPVHQQKELAEGLAGAGRNVDFAELACLQGHDSFLIDFDAFRPVLAQFFS
jgi:homoserine acetyltransferase